ncbi:ATP-dependent helicase HepA [Sedimentisphaera cyanobacteriorum]|uniref:ATP-dependent helicase HepA n=1 Tax=Sedimentisphaera cyanobacteriorum TaxID=1940790 RepID=A0A1Q2HQS9_9BACT|nr:helicase-related protein [Sedimentisphaera cyanobacteriorum]AQQ09634.1 ATP-dependent helicase HepA [Sedimentisphaera cyanobacteriorum]
MAKKLPVIIDNRSGNTVLQALQKLLPNLQKMDIATGVFEVGSLLHLEGLWQELDKIRIMMGNETTKTTKKVIIEGLLKTSDESIEQEKQRDDALTGLAAVREAISNKQIVLKTYSKAKFHAKSYLMESKEVSPVDFAIVGSSNFTRPGLTENLELNLFSTDQAHIEGLRSWYDQVWKEGEDVSPEIINVIAPHLKEYAPFTAYAKALYEFFAGREKSQDEWELTESVLYSRLSQYQKDGYHQALQIADRWGGSLVCDGVGLGKTFIGLMILERCLHEDQRILLIVPKSAEESVWRANIQRYLKPHYAIELNERLRIERHTSFGREGLINEDWLNYYRKRSDVIIMDEAHHFRNPRTNRGQLFMDLAADKKLYMLTATPINNSLDDLYHLINYFAQGKKDHFSSIRIQNLRGHFLDAEKRMEKKHPETEVAEIAEDEDFLRTDDLLRNVLIQRSRKYVKKSEGIDGDGPLFPQRQKPRVVHYSLKSVYESLYGEIKEAFDKKNPFLSLAIYNTSAYHKDPDKQTAEYQKLVVGLIRTLLLKRLESSFKAFEASVEDLLAKMAQFLKYFSPGLFQAWETKNTRWWKLAQSHIVERLELNEKDTENEEEDDIPEFAQDFDPDQHDMDKLMADVEEDMELLTNFLSKIYRRFYIKGKEGEAEDPEKDSKLQNLLALFSDEPLLNNQKAIIFTEFRNTARYLKDQLTKAGLENVEQVDSGRNVTNREMVIKRFAPYYNCGLADSPDLLGQTELSKCLDDPIDILISTDVLSEGLNLQDASLIINYDLHWNPVRLMQRIGRVDRRLNPDIEEMLDRPPELKHKVYFWNFLPPKELEDLLHLKKKLDGKILRINKTLGIEGALLTPDDPDMAMKLFNERYEGKETIEELMRLEKQRIEAENPQIWQSLEKLPKRLFSGKKAGAGFGAIVNRRGEEIDRLEPNTKPGLFACYRMPPIIGKAAEYLEEVTQEKYDPEKHPQGEVKWYFRDDETGKISEVLEETWTAVRCAKDTARTVEQGVTKLAPARKDIEKHIKNTYLKDIQAPIGAKPTLISWMEIS